MHHTCPFCGSDKLVMTEDHNGIVERVMYWIRCVTCGAQGPWKVKRAEAIGWWNTRPAPALGATIAEESES